MQFTIPAVIFLLVALMSGSFAGSIDEPPPDMPTAYVTNLTRIIATSFSEQRRLVVDYPNRELFFGTAFNAFHAGEIVDYNGKYIDVHTKTVTKFWRFAKNQTMGCEIQKNVSNTHSLMLDFVEIPKTAVFNGTATIHGQSVRCWYNAAVGYAPTQYCVEAGAAVPVRYQQRDTWPRPPVTMAFAGFEARTPGDADFAAPGLCTV
eukprot:TRINITY_DN5904_c0_g1_i1.p1 TRINITY_DN5904_c0_g1~~TRINITY_DN5904_c0_g1_i1.p1  ORF type:complete len:218 (-),score=33.20 TRINITY_DN5904_c0_g1_i1:35-649(-)